MATATTIKTTPAGLEAGKYREGYRGKAYKCSAKRWTLGHGATYRYIEGERVPIGPGDTITREEAAALFLEQWAEHEAGVSPTITRPIAAYQFDVLADMAFQFGRDFLFSGANDTTGLREAINAGAWERCEREIARWHYADGRRDAGLYNRALARVCQWNALPWHWIYDESGGDNSKQKGGWTYETPFMRLDPTDGALLDMVTPETALARARAYDAKARAAAPATGRVPPDPAPPSSPPELKVKLPPGVTEDGEASKPPPAAEKAPPKAEPAEKPRKPVIGIAEPYKPISGRTISLDQIHLRGLDPDKGAKPMTDSERFWGLFWIGAGNILFQAASRGLVIGALPAWATFLAVDALRDPIFLGALTSATVMLGTALAAAPGMIKAGIRKLRRGDATATQLTF